MALAALSGDAQRVIFSQLCNVLDPGFAVALASVSNELRTATRLPLQRLKADHSGRLSRWSASWGTGTARRCTNC